MIARIASLSHRDRITTVGLTITGIWLFLVALFWLLSPGDPDSGGGVGFLVSVAGIVLPIALVWLGVAQARELAVLRAETDDLRHHLSQMRTPCPDEDISESVRMDMPEGVRMSAPEPQPARPAPVARPRPPAPTRAAAPAPAQPDPAEQAEVDPATLIRALNFPDGPDDAEAIEALRQALRDKANSKVLRAAQDVVTLLAGRDVYMDDLPPEPTRPETWRRYAEGGRGSAVAALGGIRQPDALEIAAAMMRDDEIFRDTAHHFLRHVDGLLARLVPKLDDLQIAVLADSRTARAFMLLGRVSGVFG
ncbi:hypothetical protein [Paracoccus rhizosphaerae]|uniref:Uncharacterized protein n=1 Tax=Paracoccus rhizosphaerae TaxID=1133347 RepID=A0ABV6CGI9_9RHOB|nr:hypothetical protein [Paracoccus rhizosphaerae]